MRAFTISEFGATPTVVEIPTPEPGPGQVLIKLSAAGMNPMDRLFASGARKRLYVWSRSCNPSGVLAARSASRDDT
jgi:NADPH:quinone reductase-like Zn-dependent oxidoreductase